MNNVVGPRIKKYIESQGITVAFLSEKTGLSQPILRRILNGKSKLSAEVYFLLCRHLRLSPEAFMDSEDENED